MDDYGSALGAEHFTHDPHDPALTINLAELLDHIGPARALDPRWNEFIAGLPKLTDADLPAEHDAACPICLTALPALLAEEEMGYATDSPAHAAGELGVTRLVQSCGHVFCRKDITKWIRAGKETCPMCRTRLLPPAADEHPADADADAGAGHPRTMEDFMNAFRMPENFMEEMAPHFARLGRDQSREDADTDRSEFSSMYS